MGPSMGTHNSVLLVRQLSSSLGHQQRVSQRSKAYEIASLFVFFFCAVYKIILTACHLPGVRNSSTDALSRNNTKLFFVLNLQTSPPPTLIPCELQELVFNRVLLWISPNWTRLFNATVETALLLPHGQPTALWCVATTISVTDSTSKTHSP